MKNYQAPPIPEATIAAMQCLVSAGVTQAELIAAMRGAGLSIIPSIKLLARLYSLSPGDAKDAVHSSDTWADCMQSNEALHDVAFAAANQTGFEEAASQVREEVAS
jgi:hypothetical protein